VKHVVVIGGGISGLAAAHGCADQVPDSLRITVLERQAEVGGKAVTLQEDGWLVEAGPTGFLDNEPALDRLIKTTGLTKLPADVAAARRFVVCNGRMREIHAHPLKFARSGILSPLGMLRVVGETFIPGRRDGDDESVWEFAARRLGRQAADRLIAPMVLGVFAGDAKRLSLPAAFPRMASLEQEHGSLIRGKLALK
jgi:oxygen-dependent protoporphyrinogen oxidase